MNAAWASLLVAGILEICWALGMKYSHGFTRAGPATLTILCMIASFWFLARAARDLPIGTAYAVWTGIGAAGTAIGGMLLLSEPRDWPRVMCIGLIVAGIIGLKVLSPVSPVQR